MSAIPTTPYRILDDYRISLTALNERENSEAGILKRQAKNRMDELVGRIDINGSAGAKINKDGTYEVEAQSKTGQADKVKSAVESAFANDDILTEILEKYKTAVAAAEEAKQAQAANASQQPLSKINMLDQNGDIVEISDESRQKADELYAANKALFEARSDWVIMTYTARGGLMEFSGNVAHKQNADAEFRRFSSYLLDDAFAAGTYENDFSIGLDAKGNMFVSGSIGKEGGKPSGTVQNEKGHLESILSKLNNALRSAPTQNESETLTSLRKFFSDAEKYDTRSHDGPYANTKFPFTLRTSVKMW